MRITRDSAPASAVDVEFIGHARSDLAVLIEAFVGSPLPSSDVLDRIETRAGRASAGPWDANLEEEGPLGGDSMISIPGGDFEPDMYLWNGEKLAPDDDILFVAEARQDIPRLLAQVRASRDIQRR